jgi:hypothetical protein
MQEDAMEAKIRKTEDILGRRIAAKTGSRESKRGSLPLVLTILCLMGGAGELVPAYDCSNNSNVIKLYSLLETDACANSDKAGKVETTVYWEIVQIKQDQIIPVFRCLVIEAIGSQYFRHISAAGVTRYIRFRELKALEAWKCRQARKNGKAIIGGRTVQAKIGAKVSHAMFLSGAMDNNSNCETGIISFPNGKTLGGQTGQGLYEVTLREDFARLNELARSLVLTSGVQARVGDKSIMDSLQGTVVWEYNSMACPQTIV